MWNTWEGWLKLPLSQECLDYIESVSKEAQAKALQPDAAPGASPDKCKTEGK